MRRPAAGALLAAGVALGCASAPERPGGSFVAAGFSAGQLTQERVAVLPVDALRLPSPVPQAVNGDSLGRSLAVFAAEALATAVAGRGAAARALGPGVMAPALMATGEALGRAYEALLQAPPDAETGGLLPAAAAEDYRSLSRSVGAGFFLVPLALRYQAVEPLRFRAELDVALVDAGAGRTVWRATVSARNPTAPPGDAPDLFAATLEKATAAVADQTARRLATLGDVEPDEPIDDLES